MTVSRGSLARSSRDTSVRGPWLTAAMGAVLLVGLPAVFISGLLSNASYDPWLNANVLVQGRQRSPLDFYLFTWPARPSWLYAAIQGVHVSLALALIPVVAVKLWSAAPALLDRSPITTVARAIERVSVALLVGGVVFEFVTGILFIEYWTPFRFDFTAAHYYGAWVFFGALVLHVAVRLPTMRESLRERAAVHRLLGPELAETTPAPAGPPAPERVRPSTVVGEPPTISRRALLGTVAAGSALLGIQGAAQDIGGPLRSLAFLLPRGSTSGPGPNQFPINGAWASLGLPESQVVHWRLRLIGPDGRGQNLSRVQLRALGTHTHDVELACREGWSTTQAWTGVRLRDLAAAIGVGGRPAAYVTSLDGTGVTIAPNQVAADQSLLALDVNGVALSLDHGFPSRVVVPGSVAVNWLKWVDSITFAQEQQ